MFERMFPANVFRGLADDHGQFHLVVDLAAEPGNRNRIERIIQRIARLDEKHRRLWEGPNCFFLRMLAVIQPNAKNVRGDERSIELFDPHSMIADAVRAEEFSASMRYAWSASIWCPKRISPETMKRTIRMKIAFVPACLP